MLKKKALRKIFITTLTAFILMTIYFLPNNKEELPVGLEIEYLSGLGTNSVYLVDSNGYLVKNRIILDEESDKKNIRKIINILKDDSKELRPTGLKGIIPQSTRMKNIDVEDKKATINFSKELFNISPNLSKKLIEALVFSITDITNIEEVQILVEDQILKTYPNTNIPLPEVLTREIGINKRIDIHKREDAQKVVLYYLEEIDSNNYYVPVTKYLNTKDQKIKVIIDELSSSYIYEPNLMSFLNNNTHLKGYDEDDTSITLDFDSGIFDRKKEILEEVIYSISYSVFETLEKEKVVFKVNGQKTKEITRKDLP